VKVAAVGLVSLDSSTFVRQLADLTRLQPAPSAQGFAERLGGWLNWTDAITLATVLNGGSAATGHTAQAALADPARADAAHCVRVQAELVQAIRADAAFRPSPATAPGGGRAGSGSAAGSGPRSAAAADPGAGEGPGSDGDAFAPLRQSMVKHQRSMAQRIGALRADLRAALARASAAGRRLAELDAVLADVMGEREQVLLAGLPGLLAERHARLWPAAGHNAADNAAGDHADFIRQVQDLLLAELALRWRPIDGLLAALDGPDNDPEPGADAALPMP